MQVLLDVYLGASSVHGTAVMHQTHGDATKHIEAHTATPTERLSNAVRAVRFPLSRSHGPSGRDGTPPSVSLLRASAVRAQPTSSRPMQPQLTSSDRPTLAVPLQVARQVRP